MQTNLKGNDYTTHWPRLRSETITEKSVKYQKQYAASQLDMAREKKTIYWNDSSQNHKNWCVISREMVRRKWTTRYENSFLKLIFILSPHSLRWIYLLATKIWSPWDHNTVLYFCAMLLLLLLVVINSIWFCVSQHKVSVCTKFCCEKGKTY